MPGTLVAAVCVCRVRRTAWSPPNRLPAARMFVEMRLHWRHDGYRVARVRSRHPDRRHRGGDPPARRRSRRLDRGRLRNDPLPPRASITTARRPASGCGLSWGSSRMHRSRATTPPPCPEPPPSSSATTSVSSTTTSRMAIASAATAHALGAPRRRPGDQHRGHAVQPESGGAPSPVGPRVQRREGAPPDAAVRRDLRRLVRGPVHRHRDRANRTPSCRSSSTST